MPTDPLTLKQCAVTCIICIAPYSAFCERFTDSVRKEFQEAWQKLSAATDWNLLAQHSQQQSDDQISTFLRHTDLCNAAQTCHHSQDCNVTDAFPPEGVIDFVVDQAVGLDAAAKQLMQGAFARGKLLAVLDIACSSCLHNCLCIPVIIHLSISVAESCI